MTNSTLEKVARAIYELGEKDSGGDHGSWDHIPDEPRSFCFALARAALNVIRQVDDETVEAMSDSVSKSCWGRSEFPGSEDMAEAFTAAIDHILTEGGEG